MTSKCWKNGKLCAKNIFALLASEKVLMTMFNLTLGPSEKTFANLNWSMMSAFFLSYLNEWCLFWNLEWSSVSNIVGPKRRRIFAKNTINQSRQINQLITLSKSSKYSADCVLMNKKLFYSRNLINSKGNLWCLIWKPLQK